MLQSHREKNTTAPLKQDLGDSGVEKLAFNGILLLSRAT